MVYRIAMGVRHSDQNWKRDLDTPIEPNRPEIDGVRGSFRVPLRDEDDKRLAAP